MNYKALFLVTISALACQLVLPGLLLLAQVQSGPPSGLVASEGESSAPPVVIRADSQQKEGDRYQLSGQAEIIYGPLRLTADRIEYHDATGQIVATGNVHFFHLIEEADLQATRAEYNLRAGTGSFLEVEGSVGAQIRGGSSVLTTTNPFFFTAERVDREGENSYRVLNGELTVCTVPDPTWLFSASRATIQPGVSARLYSGKLHLWKIPVFYFPFLYKSLRRIPRSSGFLMPTIGNSSRLGFVIGDSFFWAINRSADLEIGAEYLSARGWSQQATFRVRPSHTSFLNVSYFGVVDRGLGAQKTDQGGRSVRATGVASLTYLVGDVSPLVSASGDLNGDGDTDDLGEFGNDALSTTDLIIALRAVTNLPGWRPPACSDRFDAIDSSPADTDTTRGGSGTLTTTDLIITLRRVTGIDLSRPRRASRGQACP